jgi:hypothetical protein
MKTASSARSSDKGRRFWWLRENELSIRDDAMIKSKHRLLRENVLEGQNLGLRDFAVGNGSGPSLLHCSFHLVLHLFVELELVLEALLANVDEE